MVFRHSKSVFHRFWKSNRNRRADNRAGDPLNNGIDRYQCRNNNKHAVAKATDIVRIIEKQQQEADKQNSIYKSAAERGYCRSDIGVFSRKALVD